MKFTAAAALLLANVSADDVLVTFDGAQGTTYEFKEMNDPVMGGKSTGTWTVDKSGFGVFDGEVVDVPKLKAPGFIKTAADGKFKDVSADIDDDLVLTVRTTTPDYAGFRVTLVADAWSPAYSCSGGATLPFSGGCYKAKFSMKNLGASNDFQEIRIPLNQFSDHWSPATGEHNVECADDSSVCLTAKSLKKIQRVELWAEGALGKAHLEIKSISFQKPSQLDEAVYYQLASGEQKVGDLKTVEQIVAGFLKGALAAEGFDDINKCIHDGETIIKDSEDAYQHFSKKDSKDILAGLKDVVGVMMAIKNGMSDCSHIAADWEKLVDMIAIFSSPETFAFHIGKDLLVNGIDIFHEIETAVSDYKAKNWSDFGFNVGEATAKVLIGQESQDQLQKERLFLY